MKKQYMKFLFTIIFQLWYIISYSQVQDSARVIGPRLMITNPETGKPVPLKINKFDVKVEVVDNIAVTTMDMTFSNDFSRQLEGELVFPLAEGQTVSRFAMELKGKLREGVVVEKQKGQKVFEAVVRRRIDPALLEWTPGNNFKARIFPIPSKGTKRIVIAYEQELKLEDSSSYVYKIPLEYSMPINTFLLSFQVFNTINTPFVKSTTWKQLKFHKEFTSFKADFTIYNYISADNLEVFIPVSHKKSFVYSQSGKIDDRDFFYINIFKQKQIIPKEFPKSICIYWDESASEASRDSSKEIALLQSYLKKCNDVDVKLILFSNEIDTVMNFNIIQGNCHKLISTLKKTYYDGGTQLGALDFNKYPCDEILLFTDGVSNFGHSEIKLSNTPVFVINSSNNAEHSYLNFIADKTAGEYINLTKLSADEAIGIISNMNLSFISAEYDKNAIEDVYPSKPVLCSGNITFAGIIKKPEAKIKLNFGYGKTITSSEEILIRQDTLPTNGIVERIWAQKKIKDLQEDYKNNDNEITQTGKKYSIVTRNTSLIVLDSITDYVLYEIVPPPEMQDQYYELLKLKKTKVEAKFSEKIDKLLNAYQQKVNWWNGKNQTSTSNTNINSNPNITTITEIVESPVSNNNNHTANNPTPNQTTIRTIPGNHSGGITVVGKIVDSQTGEPIPFAIIVDAANSSGSTSDIDGNFSINVPANSQLKISSLGYQSATISVTESSNFEIPLSPASFDLSTIEVIEYSSPLISMDQTTSNAIYSSDITGVAGRSINEIISTIGGLNVSDNGEEINFRGARSNANAVYVDGVRVNGNYNVPRSSIDEITVYTGGIPAQFGDLTGGVISITTRGYRSNENYAYSWSGGNAATNNEKIDYPKPEPAPWAKDLDGVSNKNIYSLYCKLKPEYIESSAFYADFSDACFKAGQRKYGIKILSNLAEIDLANHELSKILARKLQQNHEKEYAILKYQDILKLRPEEPQSYRDLGLAYYDNGQYQEAVDILYNILTKEWDSRFPGFESIVIGELGAIINQVGDKIDLSKIDKRLIKNLPVDLRVVINWDADNTDMDLWVTGPDGEKCFYSNRNPKFGGYLSQDYTRGYGPEEFLMKNAEKGDYKIQVNYYGSGRQDTKKLVTINVQVFSNYGTPSQKKNEYIFSLNDNRQLIDVEKFHLY